MTKKRTWVIAVMAGVLVPAAIWASTQAFISPSTVFNCATGNGCNVTVNGVASGEAEPSFGLASQDVTTNWTAGNFSSDLSVGGILSVSGTTIFGGGLTVAGNVTTTALETDRVVTLSSSASSQTLCAIQNNTGADRVLDNTTLVYATSTATGGTYRIMISQSATAGATGTTVYFDHQPSAPTNGTNNLTTTSTLIGVGSSDALKDIWKSGNYINFMVASPTTTLSGTCRVISY